MVIDLLELEHTAEQYIGTALTGFASFVLDNPTLTLAGVVTILVGLVVWGTIRHVRDNRGTSMSERKAHLAGLYADHIHSLMFALLHSGKISKQEYRRDLQAMAKKLGLQDLKRVSLHPLATRHRVNKNISSVKLLDASGNPIQPTIPGPKPAEVVPVPPRKQVDAKRWVAKGKSLLRRAG